MMDDLTGFELWKQGAEGRIYRGTFFDRPAVVKERFAKKYRHPLLDQNLTQERFRSEAKMLIRCKATGLKTPTVYYADYTTNRLCLEYFPDCITVKDFINEKLALKNKNKNKNKNEKEKETNSKNKTEEEINLKNKNENETNSKNKNEKEANLKNKNEKEENSKNENEDEDSCLMRLMELIGENVAKLHDNEIIHGDLTTSNLILCAPFDVFDVFFNVFFIDFGLGYVSYNVEDKSVDLYVLERAFLSTHPNTEMFFSALLKSYFRHLKKDTKEISRKFYEVRLRGRKREMVG